LIIDTHEMEPTRVRPKAVALILCVCVLLLVSATFCYLQWGGFRSAKTIEMVVVSDSEVGAAHGIRLGPDWGVVENLLAGSRVDVLWDTYGKDYWACYVRTASGRRGWVLCAALEKPDAHESK
jgi:hypothetical protein